MSNSVNVDFLLVVELYLNKYIPLERSRMNCTTAKTLWVFLQIQVNKSSIEQISYCRTIRYVILVNTNESK